MTDRMTHDRYEMAKSCPKNLSYLSFPHEISETCHETGMTHDRYDRYFVPPIRAHIRVQSENRCNLSCDGLAG